MIEHYRFGVMRIGGRSNHHDLKIVNGVTSADWYRKQGHLVLPEDIADILLAAPSILVIGQGSSGYMQIAGAVREALAERHINLIAKPTAEAVKSFNQNQHNGLDVAGAFHLTC